MKRLIFLLILLLLLIGCQESQKDFKKIEIGPSPDVFFCPRDDCESHLIEEISSAQSQIYCTFYDIDLENLLNELNKKSESLDVKLVIDRDNYFNQIKTIPTVLDDKKQLTHNKFCVIDRNIVTTGSFNPTKNGNTKNNNNLIIIHSFNLAQNYLDEFNELWNRQFGKGEKVKNPMIEYNGFQIESYFCPEDLCSQQLISEILDAEHSIYFMIFTLTDESVADAILFSKAPDIKGVFEKFQAGGKWSQFKRLKEFGIDVRLDNNSAFLHHKVFIIDNTTVVTGSYNPTSAGDNKNDENMIVIHDNSITKKYIDEFRSLDQTK
jgi:phosphatidylserine/phosphatidylglycerophosphate/cardiolipin synthase-like enzyme